MLRYGYLTVYNFLHIFQAKPLKKDRTKESPAKSALKVSKDVVDKDTSSETKSETDKSEGSEGQAPSPAPAIEVSEKEASQGPEKKGTVITLCLGTPMFPHPAYTSPEIARYLPLFSGLSDETLNRGLVSI